MAGPAAAPTGTFEFDQTENPLRTAVVKQRIEIDPADGCIQVPMRPGLGLEVVREAVEEYRTELLTIS
jgi:L-alanine-DL-glutamate epimerase-like enolase superfamily enzyme